jgi:hypothetical protein
MKLVILQLLLALSWSRVMAKTVSGDFQLSPDNTDHILGSFAIAPGHIGFIKITLSTQGKVYEDENLKFRFFKDDNYIKYQKSNSCDEKVLQSGFSQPVEFYHDNELEENLYEYHMKLDASFLQRPHYFYFVVDDCALEGNSFDSDETPKIHFTMEAYNDGSHLSADELHLKSMYTFALALSCGLLAFMGVLCFESLFQHSTVHAAIIWVMAAASFDVGSSMLHILNLSVYSYNGIGSLMLDSLAALCQAVCDSLVALLLMSIAAGWTLPSDTIRMQDHTSGAVKQIESLLSGFQSPIRSLKTGSPTAMLAIGIVVAHVVLGQLGCCLLYKDNVDSYHDFEHLPGKLLMVLRLTLGAGLIACCERTRESVSSHKKNFYLYLAIVGTCWFGSLPFVTWMCNNFVPYYLRQWTVGTWGTTLQGCSLALLSWLVTAQNSIFQNYLYTELPSMMTAAGALTPTTSRRRKIHID